MQAPMKKNGEDFQQPMTDVANIRLWSEELCGCAVNHDLWPTQELTVIRSMTRS